jgi:prepilin-type processing-associated H-X9-DG protein
MCKIVRTNNRPRAFTVLELLIVTAVVGMIIAILLPALTVAREAARCVQCKNNMRELSVAIQLYHDGAKQLPTAWSMASDKASGYGWIVPLLPHLEHVNLRQSIDCKLPVAAQENAAARNSDLPLLRCPSDILEPTFLLIAGGHHVVTIPTRAMSKGPLNHAANSLPLRLPTTNYLGVFGTIEADDTFPAPSGDGAIVADRIVRYADLQRGQSHTIIIGERTTAMAPSTWYGVHFKGEDAACRLVGSAITSPNCRSCDECEFSSRHSGGTNFVWADGHVSLVEDHIDPHEYRRLSQRRTN